ncbi:gp16 family protein [Pseudidiomarina aestuarii]|uniref:gp16 family protein n=1 Tax=Pseudidiomarina aestuarii TaxID=624146 RepID=UPI003A96EF21
MNNKAKLIQLIHVAKREMALDDETYRAALSGVCGKNSCKNLSLSELHQVLEHFKRTGFKMRSKKVNNRISPLSSEPVKAAEIRVIRALWIDMAQSGLLSDSSEAALDRWVYRMSKVRHVGWLNGKQAVKVLEALKKWDARLMAKWLDEHLGTNYQAKLKHGTLSYSLMLKRFAKGKQVYKERQNAE